MSSIPQNHSDEKALIDCVQRFFSKHHVGKLLARCNGMKEKGVSPVSLFRYKLSNIFVGRSMYMQQQTGSFKEAFSKNMMRSGIGFFAVHGKPDEIHETENELNALLARQGKLNEELKQLKKVKKT